MQTVIGCGCERIGYIYARKYKEVRECSMGELEVGFNIRRRTLSWSQSCQSSVIGGDTLISHCRPCMTADSTHCGLLKGPYDLFLYSVSS